MTDKTKQSYEGNSQLRDYAASIIKAVEGIHELKGSKLDETKRTGLEKALVGALEARNALAELNPSNGTMADAVLMAYLGEQIGGPASTLLYAAASAKAKECEVDVSPVALAESARGKKDLRTYADWHNHKKTTEQTPANYDYDDPFMP